jgi:glycosyltransferase involved in cell wall biosynthesis
MLTYSFYESDGRVRRYAEALSRRGDCVDVVSLGKNNQQRNETLCGVNIYHIQKRIVNEKNKIDYFLKIILFFFKSMLFVTLRHLKKKYQFIHVHSVPDFEVFAAIIAKISGAKVFLDIHDIVPEFFASKFSNNNPSFLFNSLLVVEKISCLFADHVIISNHLWEQKLVSRSVKIDKCTVILNYPDPRLFIRKFPKRPKDSIVAIYPGTFAWHQGLDIAIRSIALIKNEFPTFELHLYGKGPEESALRRLTIELGVQDRVRFAPLLPLEEIVKKMADADFGIVPKRSDGFGNEAFSTKILEFMSLGVPVIAANTKIDKYYFNDSLVLFFEAGSHDDLAAKLQLIASDENLRSRFAGNGLFYINNNNWDVKKDLYLKLIDKYISQQSSGHGPKS